MKLNESSKLERSKSFKVRTMLADLCCISKQSELLRVNREAARPREVKWYQRETAEWIWPDLESAMVVSWKDRGVVGV